MLSNLAVSSTYTTALLLKIPIFPRGWKIGKLSGKLGCPTFSSTYTTKIQARKANFPGLSRKLNFRQVLPLMRGQRIFCAGVSPGFSSSPYPDGLSITLAQADSPRVFFPKNLAANCRASVSVGGLDEGVHYPADGSGLHDGSGITSPVPTFNLKTAVNYFNAETQSAQRQGDWCKKW